MNVTPAWIAELKDGEVFVFGSNEGGRHGKGAAKTALGWGAVYGQAFGLQGRTFAIPTMNASISNSLSVTKIAGYIGRFADYASSHPKLKFLVTEIGCGLAGHSVKDIAPLFCGCASLGNVWLPKSFWRVLSHCV